MKREEAEVYLACHRPGREPGKMVARALGMAVGDAGLTERMDAQAAFDAQWVALVGVLELPSGLEKRVEAGQPARRSGGIQLLHPAVLAVVAGVLMIVGFAIWAWWAQGGRFVGQDYVEQILASSRGVNGNEFKPTQARAGELDDVLYMQGFEAFHLLPELEALRAAGTRVLKQRSGMVAPVALNVHDAVLHVFAAEEFGVEIAAGQWVVFEAGGFVVALRTDGAKCWMVSFRGDRAEMGSFLEGLGK